jgi:iron complex transport system ATP-binding protein
MNLIATDKPVYLSTEKLSIGYVINKEKNYLFKDLDLKLHAGQLVCFMGPNGVGKSTLIRTLAGLQKRLAGDIQVHPAKATDPASKLISVVLTDKITAMNMTVYEVVAFGRYPYLEWSINLLEQDRVIIDRSISQVHIQHLVSQKLHELSDGQLQMVMIARALAQDTPIILLDEPTAHLDLNNRVEIIKLLRQLAQVTNKAILMATHELDLALRMADSIWLADRNKTILTGMPEDLVLDGSFDRIFEFKGFDLKTGKVQHEAYRGIKVQLDGEGHEYLWTKNALERNGFEVTDYSGSVRISLLRENSDSGKEDVLFWQIRGESIDGHSDSLAGLIDLLNERLR